MIQPYYNGYQHDQWVRLQAMHNVIADLHKQRNVFVSCGLDDAARRVWGQISKTQTEADELAQKMVDDRNAMTLAMVEVFLIANLAYAKAMEFEALVKKLTGSKETDLSADVKTVVKAVEELALGIDNGGTEKQAYAFGDIIDELEEAFNEKLEPEVDRIMERFKNSKEFRKLF